MILQVVVFAIFSARHFGCSFPWLVQHVQLGRWVSQDLGGHMPPKKARLDITGYNLFISKGGKHLIKWILLGFFLRFFGDSNFCSFFKKKRMNYQHHLYNSSRFRAFSFQNRFFAVWSTGLTHSFWLVLICISMYLSNKKNPSCLGYIGYFTIYAYICYMGIIINYHKYSDTVNF